MAAVGGLRGTGDWGTDERPKDFRESIMRIRPNGTSPIFGLTSKAKKVVKTDPEYAWWAEGETSVRLQVNGALGTTDTTVTVDSSDPTATTLGANYGLATHLKGGDMLLVEPTADNATYDHEIIMVKEVISATQFTVTRGAGGTTAASINNERRSVHSRFFAPASGRRSASSQQRASHCHGDCRYACRGAGKDAHSRRHRGGNTYTSGVAECRMI